MHISTVMLLSHSGKYDGEYENLKFAPNSPKMIRLARRNTEKSEALRLLNNQFHEFLVNPLQMLPMFTNALANL